MPNSRKEAAIARSAGIVAQNPVTLLLHSRFFTNLVYCLYMMPKTKPWRNQKFIEIVLINNLLFVDLPALWYSQSSDWNGTKFLRTRQRDDAFS
jgi:hypothetical protein